MSLLTSRKPCFPRARPPASADRLSRKLPYPQLQANTAASVCDLRLHSAPSAASHPPQAPSRYACVLLRPVSSHQCVSMHPPRSKRLHLGGTLHTKNLNVTAKHNVTPVWDAGTRVGSLPRTCSWGWHGATASKGSSMMSPHQGGLSPPRSGISEPHGASGAHAAQRHWSHGATALGINDVRVKWIQGALRGRRRRRGRS